MKGKIEMGYYVQITEQDFLLEKENFDKAYELMCALNSRDVLKSGGSWGKELSYDDPRPEGMNYHPAKWFSWMTPNYPETLKTLEEVLTALGFEFDKDSEGNIAILIYNSKIGDEYHFFSAIAPLVKQGSYISWRGEDGEEWRWFFNNSEMITQQATKVWS